MSTITSHATLHVLSLMNGTMIAKLEILNDIHAQVMINSVDFHVIGPYIFFMKDVHAALKYEVMASL
jgi:hypothetical protein